ncbi:hypothetical protein PWEIH_05304 [Listeria weihenstephanensis FSL R9-0317]|uniref:Uncharacterized protein n=1 Tax=Listeria weihenstephanensis TaxID=1006155 RepID=A0A1S7FWT8_9LIST|nr:hypothetical protein [Listeria weihenstephanensis]AQY51797.1 hypothetical protein UE46_12680 [Listeria weihenstephanensis]EUJ40127.1 hypothetical protein PWEIH_05304 [Listeria weihenstephanensis FSL R9-0317]
MKKIITIILVGVLVGSVSMPMGARADNLNEIIYSDSDISISQENKDTFVVIDKDTKEESEIAVDIENKTAELTDEDGSITDVKYQQKQLDNTIKTDIIIDGEKAGTINVSTENEVAPRLLMASSSSAMKLVTTRNVTTTMTQVNKSSAALVVIGLGLVPGLGWAAAAFSVYGIVREFKGKTAYVTIKQYANNYQYRNDLYVYKDSKRTKLLNKQTGIPQRHFS